MILNSIKNLSHQNTQETVYSFDIKATLACKGVALLLLLWHHLFYQNPEFGSIVYHSAAISRVCVAMFLFLSGYGFAESVKNRNIGVLAFYKKRLMKLYVNYWYIATIFILISIFFFNRSFEQVYESHYFLKFIIQMFGLHRLFYSEFGFNMTWWYMSVIIPCVVMFPFLYDLLKKYRWILIFLFFLFLLFKWPFYPVSMISLFPFVLGIFFALNNYLNDIIGKFKSLGALGNFFLILGLIILALLRQTNPILNGIYFDWILGAWIIICVPLLLLPFKTISNIFVFLGKHLFNIFLFHTFIYYYYFQSFIYSFKYPILIFGVLLLCCLILSILLEFLKKILFVERIFSKFIQFKIPAKYEITL